MNAFAILSLFGMMVSVSLATAALIRNSRGAINRAFAFFCVLMAYAAVTEVGYRMSTTQDMASHWLKAEAFWPLALPALVHFSLFFTGHDKEARDWRTL
jgi:hypothetical protein